MGGGENIFMDRSEQEDEQRLREVVCKWRRSRVRCHESPHAEAIGSHLRLFHTVSKGEFSEVRSAWGCAAHTALCLGGGRAAGARVRMFIVPRQSGRKMYMSERLRRSKAGQERRAQQAAHRAEEIWSASSSQMRKAERAPREALYRAEMLKWRIEGGGLSPRWPRSLAGQR